MPFLKRAVLLLLWMLTGPVPVFATHLVGGELTYKFLDAAGPAGRPWRYQVTTRLYCNKEPGSSSPDGPLSIPLKIYSKASAQGLLVAVNVLRDSFTEITPAAPPGCRALAPRVTLAIYDTIFSLPAVREGFAAQFFSASRNAGVANIITPTVVGMVLAIDLAPGTLPNSSPEFSHDAVLVACAGQALPALTNAYDADGDRLSYSLAAPAGDLYVGSAIPTVFSVPYGAGYSAAQPFGSTGQASLDASTGVSSFLSNRLGYFILAVEVKEYRVVGGRRCFCQRCGATCKWRWWPAPAPATRPPPSPRPPSPTATCK